MQYFKRIFFVWGCLVLGAIVSFAEIESKVVICDDVTDPLTLDPQKQFTEKNHTLLQQIFEGLVRFDPDGKIEPLLADRWERIDPLTMRFFLRENVTFQNGEPFNSKTVKFSIDRYLDPATGFPAGSFVSSISSVTAISPFVVDVHTHYPDGLLLNRLASFILMVPVEYVSAHGPEILSRTPIGTGPFLFESWTKGKEIVLKANPNYWKKGVPHISGLTFRFMPVDLQVEAFLRGEVDILTELPGTMTLRVMENKGTRVVKKETFSTVVGHFNTGKSPLSDRRVRLAINYAINREELIRYDILGNGYILPSVTMPGEVGHNPKLKPYPFDVEKAKQLLLEAGYLKGFTLKTLVRVQGKRTAGIISKQLERINVKLNLIVIQSDSDVIPAFKNQDWDMGIAALPDPMAHSFFIQSILLFSNSPYSLNHRADYDQRLISMSSELDTNNQEHIGRDLDDFIYNEALCIPTYQRIKTYGVSRRVVFTPYVTGMPYLDSVSTTKN